MWKCSVWMTVLGLAACGTTTSSGGGEPTDVTSDVQADASDIASDSVNDTAATDATADSGVDAVSDAVAPDVLLDAQVDALDVADAGPVGEYGFPEYRKSKSVDLTCSQGGPMANSGTFAYTDWLCTFAQGGQSGYLYMQGSPKDCTCTMGCTPTFTTQAWLSIGGKVTEVTPASYDWGGNHNNDSVEFAFGGKAFKAYHSSFGFGWRKCQPMDCLQVENKIAGTVSEDGCTKDRTLPIACVPIEKDGTHAPLTDTFKPCPGDPNYP